MKFTIKIYVRHIKYFCLRKHTVAESNATFNTQTESENFRSYTFDKKTTVLSHSQAGCIFLDNTHQYQLIWRKKNRFKIMKHTKNI